MTPREYMKRLKDNWPGQPMKPRKRIAAISESKRASVAAYNQDARLIVACARSLGWMCPIALELWGEEILVECVHHLRGKNCEALRHDRRGWLLVCRKSHSWIDRNRNMAREYGFLCWLGKWGVPFKPGEAAHPGSVADMEAKNLLRSPETDAKV